MTTLYRPVLIETAEQAEQLPQGAIVFDGDPGDGDTYARFKDDWHASGYPYSLSEALRVGLAVSALVPVEAEEERRLVSEDPVGAETYYNADAVNHPVYGDYLARLPAQTRYVTPWADAP